VEVNPVCCDRSLINQSTHSGEKRQLPIQNAISCDRIEREMELNKQIHQVFRLHPGVSGLHSDDEQVAAVLTAKGRIAAATCRVTLANAENSRWMAQKIATFARNAGPTNTRFKAWCHPSPHSKRNLDLFIRCCTANGCDQQSHIHGPRNIGNNRPHLVLSLHSNAA